MVSLSSVNLQKYNFRNTMKVCILFLRIVLKKCYLILELFRTVSLSIMPDTEVINLLLVLKLVKKK